jgi:hypothetical protein
MAQTVEQALRSATLYSDHQAYVIVQLPASAIMAAAGVVAEIGEPFCALIIDKDEVSLIIPQDAWTDFAKRLPNHQIVDRPYQLITLDVELDMALVGFMARISQALAEAGVSILPLAAYSRDHILISADQFDIAMAALQKLQSGA